LVLRDSRDWRSSAAQQRGYRRNPAARCSVRGGL